MRLLYSIMTKLCNMLIFCLLLSFFVIVSSAPLRRPDENIVYHTVHINGSIGNNCDTNTDQESTGGTIISFGTAPWTVNQGLVDEETCPEPLSSLCLRGLPEDGYLNPFFEGDIILDKWTRRIIEDSVASIQRQKELAKERRRTGGKNEQENDQGRVVSDTRNSITTIVQRENGRVVITSSSSSSSSSSTHRTESTGGSRYGVHVASSGGFVHQHHSSSSSTRVTTVSRSGSRPRSKRALVKPKEFRWPDGVIPFTIDDNLPADYKTVIRMAMRHWERNTCVDFVPKLKRHEDYLRFAFYPGCWSYIGKQGGEQILSVGFTCNTMRTLVHEIGHAVGLWHEQSRRDRDKFIKVVKGNLAPGTEENFNKIDIVNITSLGFPYDFDSVMHYDGLAFTKNGAPTIKVRKEYRDIPKTDLGMKDRLSSLDIAQVNAMYECNQRKHDKTSECFDSKAGKGQEYRGEISYTEDFITCQKWTDEWPHKHTQYSKKQKRNEKNGLGEHNFCRNPEGKRARPWCFTNHKKYRWQYCPITIC